MAADVDGTRPQDAGRSHARKGSPSRATLSLLADYQEAMRAELRTVLRDLAPVMPPPGLGLVQDEAKRPSLADRTKLWDLAIKLGRELGTEIDPGPLEPAGPAKDREPRRGRRVDYGGA
jgi:hypothetical protein